MLGDVKIRCVEINGEKCVPPECMRLLMEMAEHRDLCDQCQTGWETKSGNYCVTGKGLLEDLLSQPQVSWAESN